MGMHSDGNAAHAANASVFYLFHRPRRWNAEARVWMGRERKRGKLGDLNSLLRGGHPDGFSLIVGETAILFASEVHHYAGYGHRNCRVTRRGSLSAPWRIP